MVSAKRLRELLYYDPDLGWFMWLCGTSRRPTGSVAGSLNVYGYVVIGIDGRVYQASRLAWLYKKGKYPTDFIDHKNRQRDDNMWLNLRAATKKQNMENCELWAHNTTGRRGVTRFRGRFRAQIQHNKKNRHIGTFDTLEAAYAARLDKERQLFTHSEVNK